MPTSFSVGFARGRDLPPQSVGAAERAAHVLTLRQGCDFRLFHFLSFFIRGRARAASKQQARAHDKTDYFFKTHVKPSRYSPAPDGRAVSRNIVIHDIFGMGDVIGRLDLERERIPHAQKRFGNRQLQIFALYRAFRLPDRFERIAAEALFHGRDRAVGRTVDDELESLERGRVAPLHPDENVHPSQIARLVLCDLLPR